MSTAKALRHQQELIRQEGLRAGLAQGEKRALEEVIGYLDKQAPPAAELAKKFIADIRGGKHRK